MRPQRSALRDTLRILREARELIEWPSDWCPDTIGEACDAQGYACDADSTREAVRWSGFGALVWVGRGSFSGSALGALDEAAGGEVRDLVDHASTIAAYDRAIAKLESVGGVTLGPCSVCGDILAPYVYDSSPSEPLCSRHVDIARLMREYASAGVRIRTVTQARWEERLARRAAS